NPRFSLSRRNIGKITLLRATQGVVVGSDASCLSSSKKLHDPAQRIRRQVLAHRVWTNKDAGVVERERRDVSVKRFGFAIHKQVTFHVGNIESANDSVVLVQVLADRPEGFGSSEITGYRN